MLILISETFYFQKLELDFGQELQDLIDYYKPIAETIEPYSLFTTLAAYIEDDFFPKTFFGAPVSSVCVVTAPARFSGSIHRDSLVPNPDTGVDQTLALQIPLEGTENTDTIFWESFDENPDVQLTIKDSQGHHNRRLNAMLREDEYPSYVVPKRFTCSEITRCTIDSPYMLNIGQYHSITNFKDTRRVTLSVRFLEDPWHWLGKTKAIVTKGDYQWQ